MCYRTNIGEVTKKLYEMEQQHHPKGGGGGTAPPNREEEGQIMRMGKQHHQKRRGKKAANPGSSTTKTQRENIRNKQTFKQNERTGKLQDATAVCVTRHDASQFDCARIVCVVCNVHVFCATSLSSKGNALRGETEYAKLRCWTPLRGTE